MQEECHPVIRSPVLGPLTVSSRQNDLHEHETRAITSPVVVNERSGRREKQIVRRCPREKGGGVGHMGRVLKLADILHAQDDDAVFRASEPESRGWSIPRSPFSGWNLLPSRFPQQTIYPYQHKAYSFVLNGVILIQTEGLSTCHASLLTLITSNVNLK